MAVKDKRNQFAAVQISLFYYYLTADDRLEEKTGGLQQIIDLTYINWSGRSRRIFSSRRCELLHFPPLKHL
jgi:hypothetical protein